MKCYLVTMDFSLSAERRLWSKRKLIGTFTFLVLNSFFFFFLRTNFKNIVRQISRTSDNSWLEYCERVILFFSLHCWMVRFFWSCLCEEWLLIDFLIEWVGVMVSEMGVTPFTSTLTGSVPTNTCHTEAAVRQL